MDNKYKVIYSGKLQEGVDPEQFVSAFSQLFKAPEDQARKLLHPGRELTLKDQLDSATAEKYRAAMTKIGMVVRIEPMSVERTELRLSEDEPKAAAQQPALSAADVASTTAQRSGPSCPKCGSNRVQGDDCLACGVIISRYVERQARFAEESATTEAANPYAAPTSDVTQVHSGEAGTFSGPSKVAAGNGWQWIVGGWRHFRRNPLAWIGSIIVSFGLMMLLSLVPLLGGLVTNLLAPVLTAGFMLGAYAQQEGENFEVRHLFAGFSARPGTLILVGLFYLIGVMVVALVIGAIVGGAAALTMAGAQEGMDESQLVAAMFTGPMLLAMLLGMALILPLVMAYWFAPALVAFEGMGAFAAMKLSFKACVKNMLPFLVYGLAATLLGIAAVIPVGLGLIVLAPVMVAAMYVSYRDIFYVPAEEAAQA